MPSAEAKYVLTADDRTGQAFRSVQSKFATVARTAAKVTAGIGVAAGFGFARMANSAINAADETGKLAREIGISTENLSQMRGVLELTGGDFDQYTNSIRRMQRSVVDFVDGSASMEDAFGAIGLTVEDLQGLAPEQQFDLITRALEGVTDETERSARAQEIFGRNSRTVLRLVSTGADEVARLRDEQASLGNTLSSETTQAAERFNDAIARLGQALRGAITGVVAENIDEIAAAMEAIVGLIPSVVRGVSAVASFVGGVGTVIGGGAAALTALASGDFGGARAIANQVASDVFGGEGEADKVVNEQQTTNDILMRIERNGVAARAG